METAYMYTKLFLRCINSNLFHKSSHKFLTEVVLYCKSGHKYTDK